jgi:hypothetical protein
VTIIRTSCKILTRATRRHILAGQNTSITRWFETSRSEYGEDIYVDQVRLNGMRGSKTSEASDNAKIVLC